MSKRVYILGAGSSISHSRGLFPDTNHLLEKAAEFQLLDNPLDTSFRGNLTGYATRWMGHSGFFCKAEHEASNSRVEIPSPSPQDYSLNLEDMLTNLDIDIEKSNSLSHLSLRRGVIDLIRRLMLKLQTKLSPGCEEYAQFIQHLTTQDTVISFNWDLLMDNVLKNPPHSLYTNFLSHFTGEGEQTWDHGSIEFPYSDSRPWDASKGFYLKMHGSIDWFFCPNEACRASGRVFPVQDPHLAWYCSECHEQLEGLIIPPVLNKALRRYPIVRRIWNLAAKEMASAKELVIWGYGLPPTDSYSAWLLRQTKANNATPDKVVIINPARSAIEFKIRCETALRGVIAAEKITWHSSFEEYRSNWAEDSGHV